MSKLIVRMVKADMVHAEVGHPNRCPAAEGLYRTCPHFKRVFVGEKTISWTENDKRFRVPTPPKVQSFIASYDTGSIPRPITFSLDLDKAQVKERKITARSYSAEARRKRTGSAHVKSPGSGTARMRGN